MICGTFFFCFALAFSFIAVKWPKIANRPNKQPKETSVYKKFVRFMKGWKMKTLSVYAGLVHGPINICLLLFLFRIAFIIRAVTSLKMELELEPRFRIRTCVAGGIVVPEVTFLVEEPPHEARAAKSPVISI